MIIAYIISPRQWKVGEMMLNGAKSQGYLKPTVFLSDKDYYLVGVLRLLEQEKGRRKPENIR